LNGFSLIVGMPQMTASTARRCKVRSASSAEVSGEWVIPAGIGFFSRATARIVNQPTRAPTVSTAAADRVVRVRMV